MLNQAILLKRAILVLLVVSMTLTPLGISGAAARGRETSQASAPLDISSSPSMEIPAIPTQESGREISSWDDWQHEAVTVEEVSYEYWWRRDNSTGQWQRYIKDLDTGYRPIDPLVENRVLAVVLTKEGEHSLPVTTPFIPHASTGGDLVAVTSYPVETPTNGTLNLYMPSMFSSSMRWKLINRWDRGGLNSYDYRLKAWTRILLSSVLQETLSTDQESDLVKQVQAVVGGPLKWAEQLALTAEAAASLGTFVKALNDVKKISEITSTAIVADAIARNAPLVKGFHAANTGLGALCTALSGLSLLLQYTCDKQTALLKAGLATAIESEERMACLERFRDRFGGFDPAFDAAVGEVRQRFTAYQQGNQEGDPGYYEALKDTVDRQGQFLEEASLLNGTAQLMVPVFSKTVAMGLGFSLGTTLIGALLFDLWVFKSIDDEFDTLRDACLAATLEDKISSKLDQWSTEPEVGAELDGVRRYLGFLYGSYYKESVGSIPSWIGAFVSGEASTRKNILNALGEKNEFWKDMAATGNQPYYGQGNTISDLASPILTFQNPTIGEAVRGVVPISVLVDPYQAFESATLYIDGTPTRFTATDTTDWPRVTLTYNWDTRTGPSDHTLKVVAKDIAGNEGSETITVLAEHPSAFLDPQLDPGPQGPPGTAFTWSVSYTNMSNLAPVSVKVYIDGTPYNMTSGGGTNYVQGVRYSYTASGFSNGSHTYYFFASDGSSNYSTGTGNFSVTPPKPGQIELAATSPVSVDGHSSSQITATLRNGSGEPMSGVRIDFANGLNSPGGFCDASGIIPGPSTATTNASGEATVYFRPTAEGVVCINGSTAEGLSYTTNFKTKYAPETHPDFTLSLAPDGAKLLRGGNASATLSCGTRFGFNDMVWLSLADVPAGVSASLGKNVLWPGQSCQLNISVGSSAAYGNFLIRVKGNVPGIGSHSVSYRLAVSKGSITLLSQNSGGVWPVGTPTTISWAPAGTQDNWVDVYYSYSGGAEWNLAGNYCGGTSISWTPYDHEFGEQCLVKVMRSFDKAILDVSDQYFTLAPTSGPGIELREPLGLEVYSPGSAQVITWRTASLSPRTQVTIDLSADGGATWQVLTTSAPTACNGIYPWVAPTITGTQYMARVTVLCQDGTSATSTSVLGFIVSADPTLWKRFNPPGAVDGEAGAVDPVNPGVVYLADVTGAYRTRDGGKTWQGISNGLNTVNHLSPVCLQIAPSSPSTLYLQADSSPCLYKSTDGGDSWSALTDPTPPPQRSLAPLAPLSSHRARQSQLRVLRRRARHLPLDERGQQLDLHRPVLPSALSTFPGRHLGDGHRSHQPRGVVHDRRGRHYL